MTPVRSFDCKSYSRKKRLLHIHRTVARVERKLVRSKVFSSNSGRDENNPL